MTQAVFARWNLTLDAESTRRAFSQIDIGSSESCGCTPCLNFAAQRQSTFPEPVRSFMTSAGIPIDREAEIYHNCRLESGLHSYGGWFHFVGKLTSGADAFVAIDETTGTFDLHDFGSGLQVGISTKTALVNTAFDSHNVLQLEFAAEIPWTIDAEEVT